jgi:hypothetical protein
MYKKGPGTAGGCKSGNCPDFFALESGEFLVIGKDVTAAARKELPRDSGIGRGERAVIMPRAILVASLKRIPRG